MKGAPGYLNCLAKNPDITPEQQLELIFEVCDQLLNPVALVSLLAICKGADPPRLPTDAELRSACESDGIVPDTFTRALGAAAKATCPDHVAPLRRRYREGVVACLSYLVDAVAQLDSPAPLRQLVDACCDRRESACRLPTSPEIDEAIKKSGITIAKFSGALNMVIKLDRKLSQRSLTPPPLSQPIGCYFEDKPSIGGPQYGPGASTNVTEQKPRKRGKKWPVHLIREGKNAPRPVPLSNEDTLGQLAVFLRESAGDDQQAGDNHIILLFMLGEITATAAAESLCISPQAVYKRRDKLLARFDEWRKGRKA